MRICFVHKAHDTYDIKRPGGAAYVNIQIGKYLSSVYNHDVDYFYSGKTINDENGNFHFNIGILEEIEKDYYDVVIGSCIIWPVLKLNPKKKIVLMHDRVNKKDLVEFSDKVVYGDKDIIVVCLSNSHAKTIRGIGCMNSITIIKNGFGDGCYPRQISRPSDRFKLIYAAATNETKGLDLVLQSFSILLGVIPALELTICGDSMLHGSGNEGVLRKYKSLIDKYSDKIHVMGFQSRSVLYDLYRNHGVYLAPTREEFNEPCPLGPIDAQSCGLPVVASKSGSLPELIDNGFTGQIMKIYDTGSLITGILDIISSEHIWKVYIKNNVNGTYANRFKSWEEVAGKYNDLIMR